MSNVTSSVANPAIMACVWVLLGCNRVYFFVRLGALQLVLRRQAMVVVLLLAVFQQDLYASFAVLSIPCIRGGATVALSS